jgi:hypothetical protein
MRGSPENTLGQKDPECKKVEIDEITEILINEYVYLFEEFEAIQNQLRYNMAPENDVRLRRSLKHTRAEMGSVFEKILSRADLKVVIKIIFKKLVPNQLIQTYPKNIAK